MRMDRKLYKFIITWKSEVYYSKFYWSVCVKSNHDQNSYQLLNYTFVDEKLFCWFHIHCLGVFLFLKPSVTEIKEIYRKNILNYWIKRFSDDVFNGFYTKQHKNVSNKTLYWSRFRNFRWVLEKFPDKQF